jgi:spermidine/putrescine transport system ATP-binding protein
MAGVTFDGVVKRFGSVEAVRELDLAVADGEFMVLVGPSGSGKTTALRMVAGLEAISEGRISIGSRVVNDVSPRDRDIAMVFQDYALYPQMTVRDNLAFGLRRRKVAREDIERRVARAAGALELGALLGRRPRALSGGQQQRVALARALVKRPKVLLLDEPLGALDLKLRKEMQLELKSLQHEVGITFVYVTHDQEEALTMSDRIAVMNEGKVQQVADPTTLYELPRNRFVANFIGQTNVFSGKVESVEGDRVALRTRGGARIEAVTREEDGVEVGAEAHATVRPEKVRFGDAGDNVLSAEIRQIVYLGISTQYIAELSDGGSLVLHQQNVHDAANPAIGDEVSVAWDARNCLVLGG